MSSEIDSLYLDVLIQWPLEHLNVLRDGNRSIIQLVIQNSDNVICVIEQSRRCGTHISCELLKPFARDIISQSEMSFTGISPNGESLLTRFDGSFETVSTKFLNLHVIRYITDVFYGYEKQQLKIISDRRAQ